MLTIDEISEWVSRVTEDCTERRLLLLMLGRLRIFEIGQVPELRAELGRELGIDVACATREPTLMHAFPYTGSQRVDDGPVVFGDDWPGTYIRGDASAFFAMSLRQILRQPTDPIARTVVEGLANTLSLCEVKAH